MSDLFSSRWFKRFRWRTQKVVAPESDHLDWKRSESLAIPLITLALAWTVQPNDPTLSHASFPWLWFAPVLVSLRYGVTWGLVSILPLIANWMLAHRLGLVGDELSLNYFFGGGLLVLICGEFSDVWRDRNQRMDETNLYVVERLSRLTKRHLLLNLSHDRMEQEMLVRPGSLRDALVSLRTTVARTPDAGEQLAAAGGLLQLLSQYVNIQSAILYSVQVNGEDLRLGSEQARIGEPIPLDPDDPLLAMVLQEGHLTHIATKDVSLERTSKQLVVAPLIGGNDQVTGVLSVTAMPFISLTESNLQMMAVVLGYYADVIRVSPLLAQIQMTLPTIPIQFAEEMVRMLGIFQRNDVSSFLVVMKFAGDKRVDVRAQFLRVKRGLDVYWETESKGVPVIVVLLPFATPAAKDGFIQRCDTWLNNQFDGSFDTLQIRVDAIDFAEHDPVIALAESLNR